MGFFNKRKSEVIDFTGSVGKRISRSVASSETSGDLIDFSSSTSPNMDFLGSLAGADNSSSGSVTNSLRNARQKNQRSQELNEMKLKLDDNDFKLNSVVEKVKELEMKLKERGF